MKNNTIILSALFFMFFICCKEKSFEEKVYSKYIGKTISIPKSIKLLNKEKINNKKKPSKYKIIHTIDITCESCLQEIANNELFLERITSNNVSFEIIGYSLYNEAKDNPILKRYNYPFYFDFERKFKTENNLIYDGVVKTLFIKEGIIIKIGDLNDEKFKNYVLKKCVK